MEMLLKAIKHFIPLLEADIAIIERLFEPKKLKAGEYFLEEGKICRHVGFIEKGLVRYYVNEEGKESTPEAFHGNYSSPGRYGAPDHQL
jgi:CRP-like cAMP-binding protein